MTSDSWISFAFPHREHKALADELEEAAIRTLRSGTYILGPEVQSFENTFSEYCHTKHTVAVSSGSDALVCCLTALGIGRNDEVIVPAFGFSAAPEAVIRTGANPVFVDIEPLTLGPDPQCCFNALSTHTAAIIVMHLFGQAVDLDAIALVLPGIPIVEDAAQAIGTQLNKKQVGTIGLAGTFSFFPAKALGAAGDAGAVITSDSDIADRVRLARAHGCQRNYEWNSPGGNYRMDAIQAALLSVKLKSLNKRLTRRKHIGNTLSNVLASHNINVFRGTTACQPTFAPLTFRTKNRNHIRQSLIDRHIDARVNYPQILPTSPAFLPYDRQRSNTDNVKRRAEDFPNAIRATQELLSLPCSPELRDDEIGRIIRAIDETMVEVPSET